MLPLRQACTIEDFDAKDAAGVSMKDQYDVYSLVSDIVWEDLNTSNVVCMWRKGEPLPTVSVLDMETVDYSASGGIERITITYEKDEAMAKDTENKAFYEKALGPAVYTAATKGGNVTIIKGNGGDLEGDEYWDFEVMASGKRRGVFAMPELVSILDALDFLELMGIGDWNLAWFRKDVIRLMQKGYPVTNGQGAGLNSVKMTPKDEKQLGEGSAKINGTANIPANFDVKFSYLTMAPENFDPKQVAAAVSRIMMYGGIEAVVLIGGFSQQNGAGPSLMRNAQTMTFARRARVENLLRRIFTAKEFSSLDWGGESANGVPTMKFHWGVKSLYSLSDLLSYVKQTSDGTASSQTRREMLGLDDAQESERNRAAHKDRQAYAPAFESSQALLPAMFPDELAPVGAGDSTLPGPKKKPPGKPGRPKKE